ncbi:NACHT domain-containing protein [Arthrobacter sp. KN11-1C]|uniref:NACHT domain-containing protein n=1 Tax=Arthrobacter sp. KN11-1C TaxID=3445774 RepID=UPI003FA010C1
MLHVRRFVAPRGLPVGDGYAPETDEYAPAGVIPLDDVRERRATLILGEPGAGKSTALMQLGEALGSSFPTLEIRRLDLRECYSESSLERAFDELDSVQDGQPDRLLLMDSIDETPVIISEFVRFLRRRLLMLKASRWRVVAMCRTAESVSALDELFDELEDGAVHVLLPLRRSDVTAIAEAAAFDPVVFLEEVRQCSLDSLAAVPFTLNLLLQIYTADRRFSTSRGKTYDRAISLILARSDSAQYQPIPHMELPPLRERVGAERLAAFTALTNSPGIGVFRPGQALSGMQTEYLVGQELMSGSPIELSHTDFQTLLKTPLFADSGVNERQFAHRSLRDYLAACCLIRWNLEEAQLSSFLTTSNGLSSIPPQMLDIATWLVALAPADFSWLVSADPFNLTKNRLALDRPELASALVALLFSRATEIDRVLAWHDKFEGLGHSELAAQLSGQFGTNEANTVLALRILKDSYVEGLEDDLRDLANDVTMGVRARKLAIEIMRDRGLGAQLSGLSPQEDDWFDQDVNAELRGTLLDALWPLHIDTPGVLNLLVRPRATFYGAYQSFLFTFQRRISAADAANIIRWTVAGLTSAAGEFPTPSDAAGDSLHSTITKACEVWMSSSETDDDTFGELVLVLSEIAEPGGIKLSFARSGVNPDKRRRLIVEFVRFHSKDPLAWYELMTMTDSVGQRLFSNEDLPWLAEQALSAQTLESEVWADLINMMLGIDDPDQIQLMSKYRSTRLWATIGHHFDGMEIESEGARGLRKSWEAARETHVEPKNQGMTSAQYTAAIDGLILAARDSPTEFWRLARWLDVDVEAGYYRNSSSPDILHLGCIKLLDEGTVEEVLHLALEYLLHADEAIPVNSQPNVMDQRLTAAYQALYTLEKYRPRTLTEAVDIPWVSLSRAVLEYPAPYVQDEDEDASEVRRSLLRRIHSADADGLDQAVIGFLDRLSDDRPLSSSIADLVVVGSAAVTAHLPTTLTAANHQYFGALLDLYFDTDPQAAKGWTVATYHSSSDPFRIAASLAALLVHAPDAGFRALMELAESREALALEVLPKLVTLEPRGSVRGAAVDDRLRISLFERLCILFPPADDPRNDGVHLVSAREDLARWRDGLLSSVIRGGTRQGLEAVTALATRRPDLRLEWAVAAAQESYRINGWQPITIQELRAVLERRGARLVRSNDTLLHAVIEELGCLQEWLRGETPQAFSLWDIAPPDYFVPKDENTISDWYCHALRIRLADSGLIVNREVEVRNRIGPGVGSRQDIRIEIRNPATGEQYVTVVEVKGIWHPGVQSCLKSQLADDYLVGGGLTHGVYLVVSFSPQHVSNPSKRRTSKRNLEGLEVLLREQAEALAPALTVVPVIHDGDPPWPPGQRTFS